MGTDMVITGFHAIEETLQSQASAGAILYVSKKNERINRIMKLAGKRKIKIKRSDDETLRKLSSSDHRGAVLVLGSAPHTEKGGLSDFLENLEVRQAVVLLLDGITDPQNLGAILRSCDQFKVDLVVLPQRRSAKVNSTVMKTSAGAGAYVQTVEVTNINRAMQELKDHGFWLYGADIKGSALWETKFTDRVAILMGAEGGGLSDLVTKHCDQLVKIPTSGHVDSLNVSVAAGIMLYEVRRGR